MLIPSIDLLGGKIVQLVQGEKKALEFDNFEEWISRFRGYPLIQLIDLDAAMGTGSNRELITVFLKRLSCQVGGGIRSPIEAEALLALGARRVIIGSALVSDGQVNTRLASELAHTLNPEKLVFALDSKHGRVAIQGWRKLSTLTPLEMIRALDCWCDAFLYTHIDSEGMMSSIPLAPIRQLRQATQKQLIVAGGIATSAEVEELDHMGVDAVVGMAIYTGRLKV